MRPSCAKKPSWLPYLLENDAQIKANEKGNTPLHFSANRNATEITRIPLDYGLEKVPDP